jgi:hypothetical protein
MSLFGELAFEEAVDLSQDKVMNERAYCYLVCMLTLFDTIILVTWQTVGCLSVRVDIHPRDWLF